MAFTACCSRPTISVWQRAGAVSRPPRIAAPGRFFGSPWWPPPAPCSVALNCGLAAWAGIPAPPNSGPRPLFSGALVAPAGGLLRALNCGLAARAGIPGPPNSGPRPLFRGALVAPAGGLLRGPQLRSGSEGRYPGPPNSGPRPLFRGALVAPAGGLLRALNCGLAARAGIPAPRIAAPGRFFGAPWWPPPEDCSRGPQLRSGSEGRYPGPPNSGPRPLFRGARQSLLRVPQFRIAWLSVATGTTVVRRNKYRFRILHIYAVKPITWQPSQHKQTASGSGLSGFFVSSAGQEKQCTRTVQMSTSRKPRAKLAKHRRSARKDPEPEPAERSTAETQASTERGTVAAGSALTGTQFVSFCHWLSGQKLFAGLSLFTCTFQSLRRARRAHRDRRRLEPLGHGNAPREPPQQVGRAVCLSHSPSEIWPDIHFVFLSRSERPPEKEPPGHRRP